jgi:hypothetical protein
MRPYFVQLLTAALTLTVGAGCQGTETGNPFGGGPPTQPPVGPMQTVGKDQCEPKGVVVTTFGSRAELGFAAEDVLAAITAMRNQTLVWHPFEDLRYGPEAGEQGLTIELVAQGTQVRVVDFEPLVRMQTSKLPQTSQDSPTAAPACKDELQFEVEVVLKSAGGALDERFKATLRADGVDSVALAQRVDARDLGGSFAVERHRQGDLELSQLAFVLTLTSIGLAGEVRPTFTVGAGSELDEHGVDYATPLASFGPLPCGAGGLTVSLDRSLRGFSGADALAHLSKHARLSAKNEDGVQRELTLRLEPASACAYLSPAQSQDSAARKSGSIEVAGVLTIESDDAALDGSWPASLHAEPAEGGTLASLAVVGGGPANMSLLGEAATQYDGAWLRVDAKLTSDTSWSGVLQLSGLTEPEGCASQAAEAMSGTSAPCPGTVAEPISQAALTNAQGDVQREAKE